MTVNESFSNLMRRLANGDREAAADLATRYEPHIRRVVRVGLTSPALRRQFDSVDICQSVMADLLKRAAAGQLDFAAPEQLVAYLTSVARHRLINYAKRHRAKKRDVARLEKVDVKEINIAADEPTASQAVMQRDLLDRIRQQMSPHDLAIAQQRAEGKSWEAIARDLGERPDAVRIRFSRNAAKIAKRLGLDTPSDC